MNRTIRVYSTPTCPFCIKAKQFFAENNLPFENFDVSKDQEKAEEMIRKTGQMGVPVIEIDGQVVVGFDKQRIKSLLGMG